MKAFVPQSRFGGIIGWRAIVVVLFFFFAEKNEASVLLSCDQGGTADWNDRGFYVTNYPGISLDSAVMRFSGYVAGTYTVSLIVRYGAYSGPVLGAAVVTTSLSNVYTDFKEATFRFPSLRVEKGSRLCFILSVLSGPYGYVFYEVASGVGCREVIETEGVTPPLDSFRRYGVRLRLTGEDDLVVNPGESIQAAIQAAAAGETVRVEPGVYNENIVLRSSVNVVGAGYDLTVLTGTGTTHVVTANSVTNARLEGFKITGGWSSSADLAGIQITGGDLDVRNNWIYGNVDGIHIYSDSQALIRNNLIEANGNPGNGYVDFAICCLAATPLIANNLIVSNREVGIYFAWEESSGAQVINNTIAHNGSDGIWCYYTNTVIIKNNILVGNVAGLSATHGARPAISFNDVWGNSWLNYNAQVGGVAAPGTGDISQDPLFNHTLTRYALGEHSPCMNAGDSDPIYNDLDGSRNDMGAYGGPGGLTPRTYSPIESGFIFTSVGKIPFSEITRTGALAGLANVSVDVATNWHINQDRDAPFGGWLWLHGLFGTANADVKYYKLFAAKWSGSAPPSLGAFEPISDPLTKIKYTIVSNTVIPTRESIGPDSYGCYLRTESGYWAFPDLKMIWNTTRLPDGRYDLLCKAYNAAHSEVAIPSNTLSRVTLWVDNQPVANLAVHSVSNTAGTIPECGFIHVHSSTQTLLFTISAIHSNGFLLNYTLQSLYGKNQDGGVVASDQYAGSHDGLRPVWTGVSHVVVSSLPAHAAGRLHPWKTYAYQFRLTAWARTTDGFNRLYWNEFNDHYFISTNSPADLDWDGDVDGLDLSTFAAEYGKAGGAP